MKANIHPALKKIKFVCSCGESGDYVCEAYSTIAKDVVKVEVCSYCHPFYTGKQRIVDSGGRVEKFMKKKKAAEEAQMKKTRGAETMETAKNEEIPEVQAPLEIELIEEPKAKIEKAKPVKKRAPRKKKMPE